MYLEQALLMIRRRIRRWPSLDFPSPHDPGKVPAPRILESGICSRRLRLPILERSAMLRTERWLVWTRPRCHVMLQVLTAFCQQMNWATCVTRQNCLFGMLL